MSFLRPFLRKLLWCLACATALTATAASGREVVIGVFVYQGERAATEDWSPVLDHLSASLPAHRFRLEQYDVAGLRSAIAERRVDLVITNPGYYVAMEAEFGISRIATLVSPLAISTRQALGSAIIVKTERQDLRDLADLSGKRIAAVAPEAFGGYLVAAREMRRQGIDPESDTREIRFVGLPMTNVIDAVLSGEVDAGIVRACFAEQLAQQGLLRIEALRILSQRREEGLPCALSTPLYPDWPIAVTRHTDPVLAKTVARALLSMPEEKGGLSWSVPADYQPVHDLYRELRIGPYAYLRDITPGGLLRRFWPWLLGALALLGAWVIHVVRVEHLVQRRTAELRDSLRAREAAETRMRESQEQMEHLSRLSILGEISGSLAHEINQPLTTIGNYARTVLRRQGSGNLSPEAVTEACTEIVNEAERAGGIVQRIRHFVRKRETARAPVDITAIAAEARRLISGLMAQAPEIAIENRSAGPCQALADSSQIQQVLLNLIKNAIDAGRDLPAARQGILILIETVDNRLLIHVVDRGVGLGAEQRGHLFEPFFTTKQEGLGLGLPICKTIVEAHGGRLRAEPNADGPGMRFTVSLPCHEHSA
ncbi:MAG: PhnD/SsuA/transferrin family substrate-binding protein [Rhodocyclaceae bacterium]|jgi:two-component system sensor histidine kinase TtrS|nr:PhnD/SsuA/transferrin family substrate-binding protein [Rhodocyclaceae bacterium]